MEVEVKDTGLRNVLNRFKARSSKVTGPRHVDHNGAEFPVEEDTRHQTQVQPQSPSIQWQTGPGRSSTDGAHRDNQTAWGWQIPCCP